MDLYSSRYKDMPDIVIDVMNGAQREGWLLEFIDAARRANPGNEGLAAVAVRVGITPVTATLERKVRQELPYLDIVAFRTKLTAIESQVCRVESPGGYGTGFLLGPDVLITNHHVLASVIDGTHAPEQVTLRFDYKVLADGTTLNLRHDLSLGGREWLLDWSPPTLAQSWGKPAPATAGSPTSTLPWSASRALPEISRSTRWSLRPLPVPCRTGSWIRLPEPVPTLAVDDPIFIVEHPEAGPLKLAVETKSFLGIFEQAPAPPPHQHRPRLVRLPLLRRRLEPCGAAPRRRCSAHAGVERSDPLHGHYSAAPDAW